MSNFLSIRISRACLGLFAAAGCLCGPGGATLAQERPRLIVLTDYYKDPDDKQSMIRLLSSADEVELEGLIATSLAYGTGEVHPEWIREAIDDYGEVVATLRLHQRGGREYPSPDSLKGMVKAGAPVIRKLVGTDKGFPVPYPAGARDSRSCDPAARWIGPGMDTEASEHIIRVVDRDDQRPVWVAVWGGAMDLAQALWKVGHERSPEDASRFVGKLRVYQISWQDTGAVWIWENVPELFLIQSGGSNRGLYVEGPSAMRDGRWLDEHVRQGHGALGAGYLQAGRIDGIKEGDTASFLHLLAPGLGDPEHPEWGGWGGRFRRFDDERRFYIPALDEHPDSADEERRARWAVGRWNEATSNDLAARMDWCVRRYEGANHHPIVQVDGDATGAIPVRDVGSGESVTLDASGTLDPDGDPLRYRWWHYVEAGSYEEAVAIRDADSSRASFVAPEVSRPETIHIIFEVTDQGRPSLTGYRRLIFSIQPAITKTDRH